MRVKAKNAYIAPLAGITNENQGEAAASPSLC
jgi:hypothetical protein